MNALGLVSARFDRAAMLSAAAVLIPVVAMPAANFTAVLLPALAIAGVLRFGFGAASGRALGREQVAAIAALLIWAAASTAWSVAPLPKMALTLAKMTAVCLAGWAALAFARALDAQGRRRVGLALAAGVALAFVVFVAAYLVHDAGVIPDARESFLFARHFDRGATVAVILLWPALHHLARRGHGRAAAGLLALALVAVFMSYSMAAKLALLVSAAAAAVTWRFRETGASAIALAMIGLFLVMPVAALAIPAPEATSQWPGLNVSAHHRLTIWGFAAGLIEDRPVAGHGLESARVLGHAATITAYLPDRSPAVEELLPLHPHNASLQIFLELGAVGGILAALVLATIAARAARGRTDRMQRAATMASLAGALSIAMVSYGAWQTWWLCALWFSAAMVATIATPGEAG